MNAIEILPPDSNGQPLVLYQHANPLQNPARVYLNNLSEGSRPAMEGALNFIANLSIPGTTIDTFPWHMLRYGHTAWIRSQLQERTYKAPDGTDIVQAPATANKMLSALRGTLKEAWRLGQIETEHYMRAVDLPNISGGLDDLTGHMLTLGEQIAVFTACNDGTPAGARDAAMFATAVGLGLRRAEIANLSLTDYDPFERCITVRRSKRGKTRTVFMPPGTTDAVNWWIHHRGREEGPMFPHINKSGHIVMRYITAQAIQVIFDRRSSQAKVRPFTPHDLRRTYISTLLENGIDLATVQKMAGHANTATTARYDRRPAEARRAAAKNLHVPFTRPED